MMILAGVEERWIRRLEEDWEEDWKEEGGFKSKDGFARHHFFIGEAERRRPLFTFAPASRRTRGL
jgi:hypothetical protein